MWSDCHILRDDGLIEGCGQRSDDRRVTRVVKRDSDFYIGFTGIRQRQGGDDLGIANLHCAGRGQGYRLPKTAVAITNRRYPVPPFGRDEGGAVQTHDAAILARSALHRLLVWNSRVRRGRDAHCEHVDFAGFQNLANVEYAANECASDRSQFLAVEPDISFVVDAFESEREVLAAAEFRSSEFTAVPVVLLVQAFGDGKI